MMVLAGCGDTNSTSQTGSITIAPVVTGSTSSAVPGQGAGSTIECINVTNDLKGALQVAPGLAGKETCLEGIIASVQNSSGEVRLYFKASPQESTPAEKSPFYLSILPDKVSLFDKATLDRLVDRKIKATGLLKQVSEGGQVKSYALVVAQPERLQDLSNEP